jgi:hypothetical protein
MEDTLMPISAPAIRTSKRTFTAALEVGDLQAAVAVFRQDIVFPFTYPRAILPGPEADRDRRVIIHPVAIATAPYSTTITAQPGSEV